MDTTEHKPVENNRNIQFNWATFNVPTIMAVASVLWYTATHTERQDARIDTIESSRSQAISDYKAEIASLRVEVAKIANMEYRLTTAETSIDKNNEAANARIDRVSSAMQDIRDGVNKLNTNQELLSQKMDQLIVQKKAELDTTPPALANR